jgi:hypothetical protein
MVAGREVPQISTKLRLADHLGAWRVSWTIHRMGYRVEAGLYAVNSPGPDSTYTSLSGVRREMRTALPIQLVSFSIGLILWIAGRFL